LEEEVHQDAIKQKNHRKRNRLDDAGGNTSARILPELLNDRLCYANPDDNAKHDSSDEQ